MEIKDFEKRLVEKLSKELDNSEKWNADYTDVLKNSDSNITICLNPFRKEISGVISPILNSVETYNFTYPELTKILYDKAAELHSSCREKNKIERDKKIRKSLIEKLSLDETTLESEKISEKSNDTTNIKPKKNWWKLHF